jgi:hypothetical protein
MHGLTLIFPTTITSVKWCRMKVEAVCLVWNKFNISVQQFGDRIEGFIVQLLLLVLELYWNFEYRNQLVYDEVNDALYTANAAYVSCLR